MQITENMKFPYSKENIYTFSLSSIPYGAMQSETAITLQSTSDFLLLRISGGRKFFKKTPISSSFFFFFTKRLFLYVFSGKLKIKGVHVIFPLNFFHLVLSHYLQNEGLSYKVLTLWWR